MLTRVAQALDYQYKSQPYPHQEECFLRSRDLPAFAVLFEMGAGKSKVIVDTSAYLHSKGRINAVLLVAPNGVHAKWLKEDYPFSWPDWAEMKGAVWDSSSKKSMRECEALMEPGQHLRVLCMNVEAFSHKSGFEFAKRFLNATECMMVVDESSRIKTPTATRTKNICKLGDKAKYRRILTGTPISNSPFDYYSQFMFLDYSILGQSYFAFKAQYADILSADDPLVRKIMSTSSSKFAPQLVAKDASGRPMYKNLDRLKSIIAPYSMRVTKEECLALPPKIYEKRYFKLDAKTRKLYDELRDKMKTSFADEKLNVMHKMTLVMRLQQVADGFIANNENKLFKIHEKPMDNPRMQCLMDSLEDIDGPVIIWCRFVEEIRQIAEVLGEDCVTYFGEVSKDDRAEAYSRFSAGGVKYFVGNAVTGGIGLNLTQAATVVYYSNTFSYEDRKQSEDRAHRIGQVNDKVLYIDIEAEDTVDAKIIGALHNKESLATFMTDFREFAV